MTAVSDETPPPPTAQGTFAKTPLPQVLVYVLERQLTGTIEMVAPGAGREPHHGERWARLLVIEGLPAKMQTSEPVAYLGHVLRELGFIDDAQLNMSLSQLSQRRAQDPAGNAAQGKLLHGQILVTAGVIDHAQLIMGLRTQLVRKIEHLLDWPKETRFAYYDGFDALHDYGADEDVQIDSLPLVWAAVRQQPPWEHVHATLTKIGNTPLRLSLQAQADRFEFQKDERTLVEMLREQPMRVHDLVACKIMAPAPTQLLAYCLIITKQVELSAAASDGSVTSQRVARVQLQQVAQPQKGIVEERAPSSRADARSASPLPPPNEDPASGGEGSTREKISVSMQEAAAKTKSGRATLSPVHMERKKEIQARFAAIKSQNYFEMLGLSKEATTEEVQSAFFQLAKIWHPDRVPPFLADVKDQCATVFSHMAEAHQTLSDPKRRDGYMHLLKDGGATPDDQAQIALVIDAATNFQKAEICLRRSDLVQAEMLCRKAVDSDPKQPEYLALLAWLEAMKPENQGQQATLECIQKLDQALLVNDRCERAYFYRGMLNKRLQNAAAAVKDFRRAADLNPRNIDAIREVRLFEMRKGRTSNSVPPPSQRPSQRPSGRPSGTGSDRPAQKKPAEPSLGNLFGRLFKK